MRYVVLLRGINVGGKNRVPMADLRACLEDIGCADVSTYIASGNALVTWSKGAATLEAQIEEALPAKFQLDTELIRVLAVSKSRLRAIVDNRPTGFGDHPETYHSDAIFLIDITAAKAMRVFDPRPEVDEVWPGKGVIYSQRLSAQRTRSRLGKIVGTPEYASMTIRSWSTTTKLLELL